MHAYIHTYRDGGERRKKEKKIGFLLRKDSVAYLWLKNLYTGEYCNFSIQTNQPQERRKKRFRKRKYVKSKLLFKTSMHPPQLKMTF